MSIQDTITTVAAGLLGIAIVVVILNSVFGVAFDLVGGGADADAVFEPAPDSFATVTSGSDVNDAFTVSPSTGNAIRLFADGHVDIPPPDAATRADGWALAATVEPQTVDPANSYIIYAEANATILVRYEAGNYSAYYDDGSLSGTVTAPASGDRQAVGVTYNESAAELRLYVDGQQQDTTALSSTTEPRQPAYEWDGTIDEFRRWETPVGDATHAAYASDPVQPLAPATTTHRVMFNNDDPDEVYYANGIATLVGETELVDGVEPPTLTRGTDFELATDPIRIRATSGGYLDDAPVVFVFASGGTAFGGLLQRVATIGVAVLGLLVVGLLVAAGVAVTNELDGM